MVNPGEGLVAVQEVQGRQPVIEPARSEEYPGGIRLGEDAGHDLPRLVAPVQPEERVGRYRPRVRKVGPHAVDPVGLAQDLVGIV